jgi:hypothetical protein
LEWEYDRICHSPFIIASELAAFSSLNYQALLQGIIVAAAFVLVAVGLFKPPKV